jgi:hypothetical protein
MLSKKQRVVLKIINDNSESGNSLLSVPLISAFSQNYKRLSNEEVEKIIVSLSARGYIEVINTFKKDEPYYCITLTSKGLNYKAEFLEDVKDLRLKLTITALGAVVSFIIGRILFMIFS